MKLLVNRRPQQDENNQLIAYGGGNLFTSALFKYAPQHDIELTTSLKDNPECIFILDPRIDELGITYDKLAAYLSNHPDTPIIHRVNECSIRNDNLHMDKLLMQWNGALQPRLTIFVSKWLRHYFMKQNGWDVFCKRHQVIYNGTDHAQYRPAPKLSQVQNGTHIVCAHWSDNPKKGQDVYEFLDDFVGRHPRAFSFTFIGRTKANLKNTTVMAPMAPNVLVGELSKYDICVNGTRFDPGPNAVIESIMAGLPTYVHQDGGGAVEFAGKDHSFQTFEELDNLLMKRQYVPNELKFDDWSNVMATVCAEIHRVSRKK